LQRVHLATLEQIERGFISNVDNNATKFPEGSYNGSESDGDGVQIHENANECFEPNQPLDLKDLDCLA
jgi:hypothetical protein